MSTRRQVRHSTSTSTSTRKNHFESSVDPPSTYSQDIFRVTFRVQEDTIPSRENVLTPTRSTQDELKRPFQLRVEDFDNIYNISDAASYVERGELPQAQIVERGELPQAQTVMMYVRSLSNILEYDQSGVAECQRWFIGQIGGVLSDVLRLCYPTFGGTQLVCR